MKLLDLWLNAKEYKSSPQDFKKFLNKYGNNYSMYEFGDFLKLYDNHFLYSTLDEYVILRKRNLLKLWTET